MCSERKGDSIVIYSLRSVAFALFCQAVQVKTGFVIVVVCCGVYLPLSRRLIVASGINFQLFRPTRCGTHGMPSVYYSGYSGAEGVDCNYLHM